jgi:hypothetical protein
VLYAVPMTLYVLWPDRLRARRSPAQAQAQQPAPAESPA